MPAAELYADILSDGANTPTSGDATPAPEADGADNALPTGVEYSLVDSDSGAVVATTDRADIDASARQTLTLEEIEAMKKDGTDAGRELIAKLMLSHTAIDQKTEYSLAKYKLLKTRKYIRRFSILPLDVPMLDYWTLEDKDASKIMDMRDEMLALLGCWANVHFGGTDPCEKQPDATAATTKTEQGEEDTTMEEPEPAQLSAPGRWLVVDDTGGLLVAAMAERMGILYAPEAADKPNHDQEQKKTKPSNASSEQQQPVPRDGESSTLPSTEAKPEPDETPHHPKSPQAAAAAGAAAAPKRPAEHEKRRLNDAAPHAHANTITHIHANAQPNLSFLRYFDFDVANPHPGGHGAPQQHPLARHLMTLSWLQLLRPELDATYGAPEPAATPEELYSWKTNRRSTFHRKRRRWARARHVADAARRGGFSGLVVASAMDPVSVMRHAVPLLAGGAPIAIYAQSAEALTELADCYSLARRAAWATSGPAALEGATAEERERWEGDDDFPLNPSLVLGASIQTSRVRRWQVLPGRTHPLMSGRGGAEGYVFTAWRVKPAEGKVEARGKLWSRKRKAEDVSAA